jgi:O-antigen ligase
VLIGLIISLNDLLNKKFTKMDIAVIILGAISIIWSETRGFLLAFILSAIMIMIMDIKVIVDPIKGLAGKLQALIKSKQFVKKFVILLVIIFAVPTLFNYMTLARFQTAKIENTSKAHHKQVQQQVNDESVNSRMKFIVASKDILVHPKNLIIGTGYGTTIAGRITGIEMSFLQILVEQGLIGLGLWCFLFLMVYLNYYAAYRKGHKLSTIEISMMSAFMGVLLLTNINPFINNPIGIIFLLILLVASQNRKASIPKGEV